MKSISHIEIEKTFAFQEKNLLKAGFKCDILDRHISRFVSDSKIAFITYHGLGRGFQTDIYDIIAEA